MQSAYDYELDPIEVRTLGLNGYFSVYFEEYHNSQSHGSKKTLDVETADLDLSLPPYKRNGRIFAQGCTFKSPTFYRRTRQSKILNI